MSKTGILGQCVSLLMPELQYYLNIILKLKELVSEEFHVAMLKVKGNLKGRHFSFTIDGWTSLNHKGSSLALLILLILVLGRYMLLLLVCMKKMVDQSMKISCIIAINN